MKLITSYIDACGIIADRHNLSSAAQVEIEPRPTPFQYPAKPSFPIHEAVVLIRRFRYKSDEKIAAIKALREFGSTHGVSIGLAEAKYFVEAL